MANFTPKKVTENVSAKGSLAKQNDGEHQDPPMLYLQHHHLEKLMPKGSKMPPVGSKIKISGLAHVGSTSENAHDGPSGGKAPGGEGNTKRSMTLHMHDMEMGTDGIDGAKEENQKAGMKSEIDKALQREAGGSKSKGSEGAQSTGNRTPRGGGKGMG